MFQVLKVQTCNDYMNGTAAATTTHRHGMVNLLSNTCSKRLEPGENREASMVNFLYLNGRISDSFHDMLLKVSPRTNVEVPFHSMLSKNENGKF